MSSLFIGGEVVGESTLPTTTLLPFPLRSYCTNYYLGNWMAQY